jgi:hypothetical protein
MVRIFSATLVLLTALANVAAGQPTAEQLATRGAEKRTTPSAGARIDGALRQMVAELRAQEPASRKPGDPTGARVPVTVRFRGAASVDHRRVLAAFGIVPTNEARDVVEAYVPVAAIDALAMKAEVVAIERILPPKPLIVGQGASVHNAASWNSAGRAGAGVKVGIIDVGFIGLTALIGSELPASVIGRCYIAMGTFSSSLTACESDTPHGTAVAEAVADIAPGMQLYVANPQTPLDLHSTVAWMTSQGVRVINHSVGWTWSGPGDGTTPFADAPLKAVETAVSTGATWTNAAGNEAFATWTGSYSDSNGDNVMEFSGSNAFNAVTLRAGERFIAQARWHDSWAAAARDLDLYLFDSARNLVAGSEQFQDGTFGDVPFEAFEYTPLAGGTYYLAVLRFDGSIPQWVDVQAFSGESLQFSTAAHSIANPAETASAGALAVGAAPWDSTFNIESFSSRGPTRDGRMKPDLVAADGADSVTYGPNRFLGTSQSAPHVAGLAALVLESFPASTPGLVAQYLRAIAAPRGAPNNTFGAGFAQVPVFPATVSLSALLSSTTFPAAAGQPITWTAFAIGAQAPFEYKFWLFRNGSWSVLQDYAPGNSVTWMPPAQGTYALQAWVRRAGSSASHDDWRGTGFFDIVPPAPLMVGPPAASVALPASYNTTITWTATATGGVAPLEYKFWRFREGAGWTMVRDYSTSNAFTWTPSASDAGRYTLQVWVRSAGSSASYDGWAATPSFDIIGPPPVTVTNLFTNATFPADTGTTITWGAVATGGSGPLEYRFWRFKLGVGWTAVQGYGAANTYSWTPGPADAGTYSLQVWVRQVGSSASYEAWRGTDTFAVNAPPAARLTSFIQSPAAGVTAGTPITWSATATGGTAPLQYKFWLNAGGAWIVLRDYSPLSTVTWTPTAPGSYTAQVWVRSSGSSVGYEDWRSTGFITVGPSSTAFVADLSADVSFPAMVTRPMTWTARAGGGTAPLQYKFWRYKESVGWSIVQEYSTNATYTWTPVAGEEGTYALQVWVRSSGSAATYEGWRGTDFFRVVPATVLFLSSVPGDSVGGGTTHVFTPGDGMFSAFRNFDNGVSVSMLGAGANFWFTDFAAPADAQMAAGVYAYATRYPFQGPANAGLSVTGQGIGCNESVGRFVVREALYAADGAPDRFAADFEQHCEGSAAGLYGSVRFNSTVPLLGIGSVTVAASPTAVGQPVAWTAVTATGREYRTWLYRASTRTWIELEDYTATPTSVWTPQAGEQGSWALVIWERAAGSAAAYENLRTSAAIIVD